MFEITFSPSGPGRPISPKGPISPYLQKRGQTHSLNVVNQVLISLCTRRHEMLKEMVVDSWTRVLLPTTELNNQVH